ncbi:FH2 domain-containing protein 1-like [Sphaerodactylus townsendi]|uniref:Uncharacterized protein n=1 Tax=Sphaerodactylus townsendi TaxID=933632 RepID=A0ACB8FFS5_9SAUR|nr:FH2 domain-containing protein 1-like [Sphaerodactylus townsendi]
MVLVRDAPSSPEAREEAAATPDRSPASPPPGRGAPGGRPGPSPPAPPPPPPARSPTPARRKLRTFHWEVLPAERVRGGRSSLWTTPGGGSSRPGGFGLDRRLLDELFGQPSGAAGGSLRGPSAHQASLLDSKRILNLGIFLKQFKRPVQAIVADIRDGAGALYGAEKLLELTKLLPDGEEVQRLLAFQGSPSQLSEAEVFALLLVQVPSYAHRLELLVLKEEFFPHLSALRSAIQTMAEAAAELLGCEELHDVIRLVLEAGNYMNEGGYAGSALGFHMSSLLRLADTKANRPGVDLLHFVALEAEKKDPRLLFFPRKLPHVGPASRIVGPEVAAELHRLGQRVVGAREGLEALDLKAQMEPFLHVAEAELSLVGASLDDLKRATATLCNFFCEEPEAFSLAECCRIFQAFGERFLLAAQENQAREATERRRQQQEQVRREKRQRRSIATCSARDPDLLDMQLDLLFLGALRPGQGGRSLRGPHPCPGSPQPRERPLPPRRRHTLTLLSPGSQPSLQEPPTAALPASAPPSKAKRGRRFGQGLKALLRSPLLEPSKELPSPGAPQGLRFPTLFQRKLLPGAAAAATPPGSPQEGSGLVGFFRRLSVGDKGQSPSEG